MHDDRLDKVLDAVNDLRVSVAKLQTLNEAQTKVLVHSARDTQAIRKEQVEHAKKDEMRFTSLETSQKWIKTIGMLIVGAVTKLFVTGK